MPDFHVLATFAIIAVTVGAYVSERFSMEAVALGSLAAFLALFALFPYSGPQGELGVNQLLSGFANPALATVLALLIVGQGLFATDAMDKPARLASRAGGRSPLPPHARWRPRRHCGSEGRRSRCLVRPARWQQRLQASCS